jgi:shikimate dehydrogenase
LAEFHLAGIIGWPVSGSLSPVIHNAAFRALGLRNWRYVPLPVQPGRLREAISGLEALGFAGANVTMPHKEETARLVPEQSEEAALIGAVNTLVVTPKGLTGHNTDAPGFIRFLEQDTGFEVQDREALVLGGGGAARACALALGRMGADTVILAARRPERAHDVVEALSRLGTRFRVLSWAEAASTRPAVVVNATPVTSELPTPDLGPGQLVVDLVYRPTVTPLVAQARRAGAAAFGGLGLLLHQAALSFEMWTGQMPPLEVMSAAALAELAEEG